MANCSISELLSSSNCFQGVPPAAMPAVLAGLLCRILKQSNPMASCDVNTLLNDANCFVKVPTQRLWAIIAQLLCEILHSGGTGTTCIVCVEGSDPPTEAAPCDCSLAYNLAGQFWFWNSLTNAWIPLIS